MTNTNIDYWEKVVNDPSDTYKKLFHQEENYLIKKIDRGSKVLDIGCGDGRNISSIVSVAKEIIGVDVDPKAVRDAQQRLSGFNNVKIILGSAFDLPFSEKEFDVAVLSMTLVNLAGQKSKALSEMKRVLKDNGKIIVSVYSETSMNERMSTYKKIGVPIKEISNNSVVFDESVGAHTSEQFSVSDIREMVKPLGLKIDDYEEVPHLAYIFTLKKV